MTMGDCLRTNKLIILRGNSGSGKTTIAKELQQVFGNNTMLISQDVIRRDMLKVKDGENTKALPLLEELLRYGRKHSEIVILEGILNAEWYRALFELAVALYGKNIYAFAFGFRALWAHGCAYAGVTGGEYGQCHQADQQAGQ